MDGKYNCPYENCGRSFGRKEALGGHISHGHGEASKQGKKALLEKDGVVTAEPVAKVAKEPVIELKATDSIAKVADPITPTIATSGSGSRLTQAPTSLVRQPTPLAEGIEAKKKELIRLLIALDAKRCAATDPARLADHVKYVEEISKQPALMIEANIRALKVELDKTPEQVFNESLIKSTKALTDLAIHWVREREAKRQIRPQEKEAK